MRDLGIRLVVDDSQKSRFAGIAASAQRAQADMESRMGSSLGRHEFMLNRFGASLAQVGVLSATAMTVAVGGLTVALKGLGSEFVSINEKFGNLQITLGSALRSMTASKAIVNELANITANSPIPFQNLANIVSSFAVIPQTSQQLVKQTQNNTLGDPTGFLRRSVRTVEAMRVFRPDQDEESAIFAIREALGGQMRSLIRRFDIPSQFLQTVSKKSTSQLKDNPMEMFNAIEKAFTGIISPEAVSAFARQPTTLARNFREQAVEIPLLRIGQEDLKTGKSPYTAALIRAQRLFDELVKFITDSFETRFAGPLREALSSSSSRIFDAFGSQVSRLLDSAGVKGQGAGIPRVIEGVVDALIAGANALADFAEKIESTRVLDTAATIVKGFIDVALTIIRGFVRLAEITSPSIAAFAALASPVLLSNIGSVIRVVMVGLPKLFTGIASLAWGSAPAPVTPLMEGRLNAPTGFNILGMNRNVATPDFLEDRSGRRGRAKNYRDNYLANPILSAGLDPGLTLSSRNAAIERDRIRDIRWMENNPAGAAVLERRGISGNRLVGVSIAAARQAEYEQPVAAQSRLSRFGAAAGGMALGALTSVGIGLAITGVVAGLSMLYESLTASSKAIQRVADDLEERRKDFRRKQNLPDLVTSAQFLNVTPESFLSSQSKATENRLLQFDQLIAGLNPKGQQLDLSNINPIDPYLGTKAFVDGGATARMSAHTPFNRAKAQLDALQLLDISSSMVDDGISVLTDVGVLSKEYSATLTAKFIVEPVEALKELQTKLTTFPGGIGAVNDAVAAKKSEQLAAASKAAFTALTDKFGSDAATLITKVSKGMLNPSNLSDVKSQLEESSGIQALRGRILLAQEVTQNSFVGRLQDESAATYTKDFGSVEVIEKLRELRRNATAAREGIGNILSDLELSTKKYEDIRLSILDNPASVGLPASKAKELVDSLKGLNVAEARATLKTYFKTTLDSLSDSGQLFTTTLQAFGSEFSDFTLNFAKFTQTEFVDKLSTLNEILRAGNIQLSGAGQGALLKGTTSSRLNIQTPLKEFQGTDTQVAESRIKALKDIQREANRIISTVTAPYPVAGITQPLMTFSQLPKVPSGFPVPYPQSPSPFMPYNPEAFPPSLSGNTINFDTGATASRGIRSQLPLFGDVPKTPNAAELARLRQISGATPEQIKQEEADLSNKRIDAIQSTLRGDSAFNPTALRYNPDLIDKLTKAGLASSAEARAADTLSPIRRTGGMEASLDRQMSVANILKDEAERVGNTKRVFDIEVQIQELYVQRALIARDSRPEAFFEGMLEGLTTAKEKLTEFGTMGKQIGADIKNSFGEAFANIVTGTMSVSDAFTSMAVSIMRNVAQIFAQKAAAQLINMVLSSFAGSPTGGSYPLMGAADPGTYATGGPVRGGSGYRDDVPALLMGGEYVINKRAAMDIGRHNLDSLNRGNIPRFAAGGPVGSMAGLRSGSSFASSSPVANYHTSTVTIHIDQNGKAQAESKSSALDARELSDAIEGLIEEKFQQKMRAGQQLNPMNRR